MPFNMHCITAGGCAEKAAGTVDSHEELHPNDNQIPEVRERPVSTLLLSPKNVSLSSD